MEDFGDIFYVLAMLAALVFSAFKKQRKGKRNVATPQETDKRYDPMQEEDILEDLKDLFQPKEQKQTKPALKKEEPKTPPLQTQTTNASTILKSRKRQIDHKPVEDNEIGFEFNKEEIDLRQAVIYAEILNRPYQ